MYDKSSLARQFFGRAASRFSLFLDDVKTREVFFLKKEKKNLRKCCNQSQRLCGFLKELGEPEGDIDGDLLICCRVKCHIWRSGLGLNFDPVCLCVFPKGHGAKCAQSNRISSYRHQRALLLPSSCLLHADLSFSHCYSLLYDTCNQSPSMASIQSSWIWLSFTYWLTCVVFWPASIFRSKNHKFFSLILAFVVEMCYRCD